MSDDETRSALQDIVKYICSIIGLLSLFVIVPIGLSGPFFGPIMIYNTLNARGWPAKKAVITSIKKETDLGNQGSKVNLVVRGRYLKSKKTFKTYDVRYGDLPFSTYFFIFSYSSEYQYVKGKYGEGNEVTVYHEPGDPSTVILEQNDIFTPIVYMIISALILLSPFWWPRLRDWFSSMEQ